MGRHVAIFARRGLFVAGVVLIVSVPMSFLWWASLHSPVPYLGTAFLRVQDGTLGVTVIRHSPTHLIVISKPGFKRQPPNDSTKAHFDIQSRSQNQAVGIRELLLASFDQRSHVSEAEIPLWLLAAASLAWPATSLFLRRRGERRGFKVKPAEGEA